MKKWITILIMVVFLVYGAHAQQLASGTVLDNLGEPLIGANILAKGSSIGTITDIDGRFEFTVPDNIEFLVISYTGYEGMEVAIGTDLKIELLEGVMLQEAVVTALGISRDRASLGYSQQQVGGQELNRVQTGNFVNNLSGKVSGVQIRTNNNFGGSTNIVIRGNSSLTGENQPLFVVDGVPVDNSNRNLASQAKAKTGYDYGNAASDINPSDIETMSVLKGAGATALYGSRAANGVVLITTKKGAKNQGLGISVSSSLTFGQIDKSTFLEYQNKYGAGYGPDYGSTGYFEDIDVNKDGVLDLVVPVYDDASYGGKFDPNLNVYQWESFIPESPLFGQAYPYLAAKTTPVDFFETETTTSNNISLTGGNDAGAFRLSYTHYNTNGILPNSELEKHTVSFNSSYDLGNKLTAAFNGTFSKQDALGRNSTGYSDNLMSQFRQWWQVNVDVDALERYYHLTGRNVTWNSGAPWDGDFAPLYWDNPYWTRFENFQTDERNRLIGSVSLTYDVTDKINIMGRFGMDNYDDLREERRAVGSTAAEFGVEPDGINREEVQSGYQRYTLSYLETNFDLIGTYETDLSTDFSLKTLLGLNIRKSTDDRTRASTAGGLVVPHLYALSNSLNPSPLPEETLNEKQVNGYYASVSLGYKDFLFLDLTDRVDISSTLPVDNNTYNYFSISSGFVFSRLLRLDFLNFSKLRASYGEVGNDAPARSILDTYRKSSNFGTSSIFSLPDTKNNADLKPERTKSLEFGLEMGFLDNRLGFDFSWYKNNTVDQILPVATSKTTGYTYKFVNAGEVENKGIELILNFNVIRSKAFNWHSNINFTKNDSKVLSLFEGVDNLELESYQGGISINATIGQPYGTIRGTGYKLLDGQRVVNSNGYYIAEADQVIGNMNPDWIAGWSNAFSYKNLSLNFLIDVSQGGDIYSLDLHYGQGTGLPYYTAGLNDLGNPIRDPVVEGQPEISGGIIFKGVKEDGSVNDIRVPATETVEAYYWGNSERNPGQMTVYDASYVKLRELGISYDLPVSKISKYIRGATISLVGRNLWIIDKNILFADPETGLGAGNAQGYSAGAYPTVRSMGLSLKLDL
ncbi:SusC/RagA family TonB-linked outer membrane protein [Membranihabitans marinus]|uniref:SusC/RagA family TonB-linked outer membrane protein n=1 Tax=Membranihabitans marinus TaxID=1227546 RepID=UPI001EFFEEED|nr:SusC/RagA family TonB-linked outer membrane protein [Membranihabitans marinus]